MLCLQVYKIYCGVCNIFIRSDILKIAEMKKDFYSVDLFYTNLYKRTQLCSDCLRYFRHLHYQYPKNIKQLKATNKMLNPFFKYKIIGRYYNKWFIRHLELQKKINLEIVEEIFKPERVYKFLLENDDVELYMN